jgi:hypothetical protein
MADAALVIRALPLNRQAGDTPDFGAASLLEPR